MQREEYIDTIKKRLEKNGHKIVDGGHIGNQQLIFSAPKDNSVWWLPGNEGAFFFVTEIESLDIDTLKKFTSDCSYYAHKSLKKGLIKRFFPPLVFNYSIAITKEVDSLLMKIINKTKTWSKWGAYVSEFPIAVIPEKDLLLYPTHPTLKGIPFTAKYGPDTYDISADYIEFMLSPTSSDISEWPPPNYAFPDFP